MPPRTAKREAPITRLQPAPEPVPPGRVRPVIESVEPVVDDGDFPAKREIGDEVVVEADVFADGHDELACELRFRHESAKTWSKCPMRKIENDRWRSSFRVERLGTYRFCVSAAIDPFGSWARDMKARVASGQDVSVEVLVGAGILEKIAGGAKAADERVLGALAEKLRGGELAAADVLESIGSTQVLESVRRYPDDDKVALSREFEIWVDPVHARFSTWYEMFPRSTSAVKGRAGNLSDAAALLPYVSGMGFDVVYLPPVHPIGETNRKGRDGAPRAKTGEPGSPWAIGASTGGHTAVHPELGTVADVERLVEEASELGIRVALDLALQCSPDHPWVKEHPEWFKALPDGSIRYAENPPKRYEDIYPIDFETSDWQALWEEIEKVVRFWIGHGIRVFRVDNPHTKPLRFWQWLIASVKVDHPDIVFLSEAFTRPKVMHRLAKVGFSQSYTYFAWRTEKWELEQYVTELHTPPVAEFMRANLWPNTPDILTEQLQTGGRPTFMSRLVLAATMASSYGIYGPVFELQQSEPRHEGSEEYLHSEKYEVRHWDRSSPTSLAPFISTVNQARRDNPALQHDRNVRLHHIDNDRLIAFSRHLPGDGAGRPANTVIVVVNLDPVYAQSGWLDLDLDAIEIDDAHPFHVHDALSGSTFEWGGRNFVSLDPKKIPAHVLRVERPKA